MYFGKNEAREKSQATYRTILDVVMGVVYPAIGTWVLLNRSFGNVELPLWVALPVGMLMIVGGLFRLVKGVKAAMPAKQRPGSTE